MLLTKSTKKKYEFVFRKQTNVGHFPLGYHCTDFRSTPVAFHIADIYAGHLEEFEMTRTFPQQFPLAVRE